MNYEELYQKAMKGDEDALKTLCEMAGRGDEKAQYVLSCVYDNPDSPFKDVDLGMHWLKTSAEYNYELAIKKIKELSSDFKRQYGIEDNTDANASNAASDSILSYEGRIDRTTYFVQGIVYGLIFVPILFIVDGLSFGGVVPLWVMIGLIIRIIGVYLTAALWVKRLHDCGRSGWWALLMPITQIVIQFLPGEDKDNEYGPKLD